MNVKLLSRLKWIEIYIILSLLNYSYNNQTMPYENNFYHANLVFVHCISLRFMRFMLVIVIQEGYT